MREREGGREKDRERERSSFYDKPELLLIFLFLVCF